MTDAAAALPVLEAEEAVVLAGCWTKLDYSVVVTQPAVRSWSAPSFNRNWPRSKIITKRWDGSPRDAASSAVIQTRATSMFGLYRL